MPAFFRTLDKVSNPEDKAVLVYRRLQEVSPEERKRMTAEMELLGLFDSSQQRFQDHLIRLYENPELAE